MGKLKENVYFSHLGKKGAGPQKSKIKSILGLNTVLGGILYSDGLSVKYECLNMYRLYRIAELCLAKES